MVGAGRVGSLCFHRKTSNFRHVLTGNIDFRYILVAKPLVSSSFLFVLAGKLYLLDVFKGKRIFSVCSHRS